MLVLFSRKQGKISVATNLTGAGKNKSALATKAFTYGHYELFKGRDIYNLNSARVLKSHFDIGDDLDRFMASSYVLELTDKLLIEDSPEPKLFQMLVDFLDCIEKTNGNEETLVMAYIVKALNETGTMPELDYCTVCGKARGDSKAEFFSIPDGGIICADCAKKAEDEADKSGRNALIYKTNFDIINILNYFKKEPFERFVKLKLDDKVSAKLKEILKKYMAYHLEIENLKSEFVSLEGI